MPSLFYKAPLAHSLRPIHNSNLTFHLPNTTKYQAFAVLLDTGDHPDCWGLWEVGKLSPCVDVCWAGQLWVTTTASGRPWDHLPLQDSPCPPCGRSELLLKPAVPAVISQEKSNIIKMV